MEVGKLRYGRKPEPLALWFDAQDFRLTPLPPVIAVLEKGSLTRQQVIVDCDERFGVKSRKADELIADERDFLIDSQEGHQRILKIDPERAKQAPWHPLLESASHPMTVSSGPQAIEGETKTTNAAASLPSGAE
jgi:hypothetical protein